MKTIFTGFSPNLTKRDVYAACRFLFLPWYWPQIREGEEGLAAEAKLSAFFGTETILFDSGRTALALALNVLGVKKGDAVYVQAYTCVVVINAIHSVGAVPIFIDVDERYCMNATDLQKKLVAHGKVLLIQHTFGHVANLDELLQIAKEQNVRVIEDCAHSLGVRHKGQLTGTFGDIGFYSFGSDKVISCVRGGAAIARDPDIRAALKRLALALRPPKRSVVIKHLLHLPLFFVGKKLYRIGIGKMLLATAKKLRLMSRIIEPEEKEGKPSPFFPCRLANSLALLLNNQIEDINAVIDHSKKITKIYRKELTHPAVIHPAIDPEAIFFRYTIRIQEQLRTKLFAYSKQQGILLGNWYDTVIAPSDTNIPATLYKEGLCPDAEKYAKESLNLPIDRHISEDDARRVVGVITDFLNKFV